ncbi:hypothetical protein MSAN_02048500 [Mycena sanguinolenta]|uniref:Zn(2)-C6 fungal-type domain-containing protein n=1 Tax=Mycena sanguinolenta TaxID=230812 RepID=A0A8H6XK18_9AGAR|nr:hypothetical protein MSAN_02048500 [Mycena sanguinolenta]
MADLPRRSRNLGRSHGLGSGSSSIVPPKQSKQHSMSLNPSPTQSRPERLTARLGPSSMRSHYEIDGPRFNEGSSASDAPSRPRDVPMAVACTNCRRWEIKCVPDAFGPGSPCVRCQARGIACEYVSDSEEQVESTRGRATASHYLHPQPVMDGSPSIEVSGLSSPQQSDEKTLLPSFPESINRDDDQLHPTTPPHNTPSPSSPSDGHSASRTSWDGSEANSNNSTESFTGASMLDAEPEPGTFVLFFTSPKFILGLVLSARRR